MHDYARLGAAEHHSIANGLCDGFGREKRHSPALTASLRSAGCAAGAQRSNESSEARPLQLQTYARAKPAPCSAVKRSKALWTVPHLKRLLDCRGAVLALHARDSEVYGHSARGDAAAERGCSPCDGRACAECSGERHDFESEGWSGAAREVSAPAMLEFARCVRLQCFTPVTGGAARQGRLYHEARKARETF